jgi:hypothetical protein
MNTRAVIVGTAPSYTKTPWTDPACTIVTLNDAYALNVPRIDEHYELHDFAKMWFKPEGPVDPRSIPKGAFIRPAGHLEWLKRQAMTIPVWLQKEPPADWPVNAARLPIEQIEAEFGQYWASGPVYEIAHLYLRGYREFEIYGIHLSTEHEYREQRPNFEFFLGRLLGPKVRESRDESRGLRIYEGHIRLVLPVESPILQHGWKYAYEPKPVAPPNPYADELARTQKQKRTLEKALIRCPVGFDKTAMLEEYEDLEVIEIDCLNMVQRSQGNGTLTAVLPGV